MIYIVVINLYDPKISPKVTSDRRNRVFIREHEPHLLRRRTVSEGALQGVVDVVVHGLHSRPRGTARDRRLAHLPPGFRHGLAPLHPLHCLPDFTPHPCSSLRASQCSTPLRGKLSLTSRSPASRSWSGGGGGGNTCSSRDTTFSRLLAARSERPRYNRHWILHAG